MDDLYAVESRLLRERIASLEDRILRRLEARAPGVHRLVGQVYSQGAIPTTSGKFYACHPVTVTGTETEGSAPVLTADATRSFLVDLIAGTAVAGDYLVCRRCAHRWVARKGGATTPTCSACGCVCGRYNDCNLIPAASAQFGIGGPTTLATGMVTAIAVAGPGGGYYGSSSPAVTVAAPPGAGTTATATAVRSTSVVTALTKTGSGSGYEVVPNLTVTGGAGGSGCTGHVTLVATTVDRVVIVVGGTGYDPLSPPAVTFSGGGGTGAAGTAVVNGGGVVTGVTITGNGTGYTSPPTVTIAPPTSGTTATATSRLAGTSVNAVVRDVAGSGYRDFPTVTIDAPTAAGGTSATATASINSINVASITVTDPGSGYSLTSPPAVTIAPPTSGTTALGTPTVTYQDCIPYPSAGTYTLSYAPPSGVAGMATGTISTGALTCDGARHVFARGPNTIFTQQDVISTYACLQGIPLPIKKTLFVTVGGTLVTLTLSANASYAGGATSWTGTANLAQPHVYVMDGAGNVTCGVSGTSAFTFTLGRSSARSWSFTYQWRAGACDPSTAPGNTGCGDQFPLDVTSASGSGVLIGTTSSSTTTFTNQPFSVSLAVAAGTIVGGAVLCPPGTVPGGIPAPYTGTFLFTE